MELEELEALLEDRMRKSFSIFILSIIFLSVVSASVNEYNSFKLGELDSSSSLIRTGSSVSGVSVRGFICSNVDCSGSLGDLWGGLYSSGSGMNLVYPTVLASSSGYGFWVYKDGYVPYWVKGVTWYGTGTVPGVDRYLAKKQNCVAGVDVESLSEVNGTVSASVRVNSPILNKYGSMYVPSEVAPHLKSLVDVGAEILNSNGVVVWSQNANRNIDFSGNALVPFSANLGSGNYTFRAYTTLGNEPKCLAYTTTFDNVAFDVYDDDKDDDGVKENVDCNDLDASVWQMLNGYRDSDLDGFGVNPLVSVCSGLSLPAGYVLNNNDCNDNNAGVWRILNGYRDSDGDGYSFGSVLDICSGLSLPFGYEVLNDDDCDDSDASVWEGVFAYADLDGDGFGAGVRIVVCSGVGLPAGYVSNNDDCDDSDFYVNPSMMEICGDGIDNDCDGFVDEGCNSVPLVASVVATPVYGVVPLDVSFSCVGSGGDGDLEYFWDLGNGDLETGSDFIYTYDEIGEFDVECGVRDEDGDEAFGYVNVEVVEGTLNIIDLICFDSVIVGHNQSCSVFVEDDFGNKVGGIDVEIFYSDGSSFGECVSDRISGACGIKALQNVVGDFEVYAVASGDNFVSDETGDLKFLYEVVSEEYNIIDLKVFNDSSFSNEDYDFFRGENLFVSFSIEDINNDIVYDNLISEVSLVSSVAGGRVDLEFVDFEDGVYYYRLIPVPITHDFLGDSNVFAFVFDLVSGSGGQEEVSLIIRNNLPFVSPVISGQNVVNGRSIIVDLEDFENDVEDSGDALSWEVISFEDGVGVVLNGKNLVIEGLSEGDFEVVLRLVDLDLDYEEVSFNIEVSPKKSSGGGSSVCRSDWECSAWSECGNGVMVRDCIDDNKCSRQIGRPVESQSCSASDFITYANNSSIVDLSDSFVAENEGVINFELGDYIYWIIGILVFLILLIFFVIILIL